MSGPKKEGRGLPANAPTENETNGFYQPDGQPATLNLESPQTPLGNLPRTAELAPAFKPFPVNALPAPICDLVSAAAKAIGCDPSYLALPVLTALGSAIGNARRLQLKRGWRVPPILWTAIVGESGTSKTPAFKLALRPVRERQHRALKAQGEKMIQYEADLAVYEQELTAWKRSKKRDLPPPEKPLPPQAARFIVSDTTVEAMAPILSANANGLLLARDELAGWIGSFDRYSKGKGGADAANWLSMHNGENLIVDRKGGTPPTIFVEQASVSVCGGIQPPILKRALGTEHRESGLAARLLLAYPPRRAKTWTDADIDPALEAKYAALLDKLYELRPTIDDEGNPKAVIVRLALEAEATWKENYNRHNQEQLNFTGELSAAWSKLEEYVPRLALVVHYTRWAAGDRDLKDESQVDLKSILSGIQLVEWFKNEAQRLYGIFSESEVEKDTRELVEWIQQQGNCVSSRDLCRRSRKYQPVIEAEKCLNNLKRLDLGDWKVVDSATKQGSVFELFKPAVLTDSSETAESDESVSVNSTEIDTSDDDDDDTWGEV